MAGGRPFFKTKNLCSQSSCDHIQWFQWLQVVIHHRYVTLVWCHIHWSSQKGLKVIIISTNVMNNFSGRPLYQWDRHIYFTYFIYLIKRKIRDNSHTLLCLCLVVFTMAIILYFHFNKDISKCNCILSLPGVFEW